MQSRSSSTSMHLFRSLVACVGIAACTSDGIVNAPARPRESQSVSQRASDVGGMANWNIIALRTTLAGPFSPPRESRSLAIVFGAVNDAVCSIMRECGVYAGRIAVSHDASVAAAVDAAAHDALVALYPAPATVASLNASYDSALATLPANEARDAGVAAGQAAAATMLALRANDHSQDPMSYAPTPGLGSWVPTPPAFAPALEPEWGSVTPFLLESGSQLRPPGPPAPGSDAYVRDYLEIQDVGAANSTTRTAAQTEVCTILGLYRTPALEPGRAAAHRRAGNECREGGTHLHAAQHGRRRCNHRRLGREVRLRTVAAADGDPELTR
jgi:hypothetical protein